MPDWTAARAQMMLEPEITNLNTGSFGPTPRPVFDRVTELRRHQAAAPWDFMFRQIPPLLWRARERLAEFLGTRPTQLVFCQNVSSAVNMVASGLRLEPGEILTSDREYGAMFSCWNRAARRLGMELKTFPLPLMPHSAGETVDAVEAAITPRTRLLFFSHVYSATGMVVPARALCSLARRYGVLSVVDGAHAPSTIDLNVDEINADFYAGNCHKWLLAPTGSGFLVARGEMLDRLEPMQVSWGYPPRPSDDRDEFGSTPRIRALEFEGTREITPWLVVPDAVDFQATLGCDAIRERMRQLAGYIRKRLDGRAGLRLTTPPHSTCSMVAFWTSMDVPIDEVRRRLWDRRIEIPVTEWPDGRVIRLSAHFYTTEAEVDRFADCAELILE